MVGCLSSCSECIEVDIHDIHTLWLVCAVSVSSLKWTCIVVGAHCCSCGECIEVDIVVHCGRLFVQFQ